MFCSKCKTEVKEGVKFCYSCGSEIHLSEKKWWNKSTMPIVIACLLIVIIAAVTMIDLPEGEGSTGAGTGISEVGFDTPEEALIFYLEGLRDSDLDRMLSAFAIESFVENHNFEYFIERIRAYSPFADVRMPNANDFVESMNLTLRLGIISSHIGFQYLTLTQLEFDFTRPHPIQEPESVDEFVQQFERDLDSPDLESIEIIGFIPPEALSEQYLDRNNQMNIERQAVIFGVEEIANRVVVFQMGRHQYMLFVEVGNYDGQWHLLHFGGNAAALVGVNQLYMGLLVPEEITRLFDDINIDDLIVPID